MLTTNHTELIGDQPKDDPSLTALREAQEDMDKLAREFPARQTQLLPKVRYALRQSKTGEHPPVRSTSTDSDHLLILPEGEEGPLQDTLGETGAPYYGQDDEESVGSAV